MLNKIAFTIVAGALTLLVACGSNEAAAPSADKADAPATTLPEGLLLAAPPADALPLADVRATARAGQRVTFTGYIGGREDPITHERAIFLVADSKKAPACTPDHCKTPWDACCVDGEVVAANTATVRVLDAAGKPLRLDLTAVPQLAPGTTLAVVGTVAEADENVLVVNAEGLAPMQPATP